MPFGGGDRALLRTISDHLTQTLTDLAALKQQVADQQQAIERIRHDTTAAIQLKTANDIRPTEQPAPQPVPAPEEPRQPGQDLEILQAAAGISAAVLHAHRDTWEFLVKHAGQDQHFHLPGEVKDAAGTVLVKVSGPSLVAALTSLHRVSHTGGDDGTRAIAAHLHGRLTETVQEIVTRPHRGDGPEPVRIVIDDRAKPANDDEE